MILSAADRIVLLYHFINILVLLVHNNNISKTTRCLKLCLLFLFICLLVKVLLLFLHLNEITLIIKYLFKSGLILSVSFVWNYFGWINQVVIESSTWKKRQDLLIGVNPWEVIFIMRTYNFTIVFVVQFRNLICLALNLEHSDTKLLTIKNCTYVLQFVR